jgi:hypothetical protein
MNKPEDTESFQSFKKSPYFSTKCKNYFEVYDQLFSKYRGQEVTFIEIGILQGGSLFMWRDFLGPRARIIGIDLNPDAKRWEEYGFEIFIGDQSKEKFWREFVEQVPNFDVLLDDGGHTNLQQLVTLAEMAKAVNPGGVIVVEDTHSSYQREFGNPGRLSFINVSKRLVDALHLKVENLGAVPGIFKRLNSIEYFDSIVAFKFGSFPQASNEVVNNQGLDLKHLDYRYANHNSFIRTLQKIETVLSLNYEEVGRQRSYLRVVNLILNNPARRNHLKIIVRPIHKSIQFTISAFLNFETYRFVSKVKF